VVAECHVVLDFPPDEHATYAIKVYQALKGAGRALLRARHQRRRPRQLPAGRRRDTPEEALRRASRVPASTTAGASNRRAG